VTSRGRIEHSPEAPNTCTVTTTIYAARRVFDGVYRKRKEWNMIHRQEKFGGTTKPKVQTATNCKVITVGFWMAQKLSDATPYEIVNGTEQRENLLLGTVKLRAICLSCTWA
jgi:hypothetical protein